MHVRARACDRSFYTTVPENALHGLPVTIGCEIEVCKIENLAPELYPLKSATDWLRNGCGKRQTRAATVTIAAAAVIHDGVEFELRFQKDTLRDTGIAYSFLISDSSSKSISDENPTKRSSLFIFFIESRYICDKKIRYISHSSNDKIFLKTL